MPKSQNSTFELPEYLFKKPSQTSRQQAPDATFDPASAVAGREGFVSQTAPNQQPQKKQIFLDYNSIYRLWNPTQLALTIAKLKEEGFEVFIIQAPENERAFASKIDDDLKFTDKKFTDKKTSIFELSDDFIEKNFSKKDHKKSAEELSLASDDSIILNYSQLKEIHDTLTQEHWDDKKKITTRSHLSYSFLDYAVEEYNPKSYEDVIELSKSNIHSILDLLNHEKFDIKDEKTVEALSFNLNKMTEPDFNIFFQVDEKKLGDLFDIIPSLNFDQEKKELLQKLQKVILKNLWFKHPDFAEGIVARAKTLHEFEGKKTDEIAILIHENSLAKIANSAHTVLESNPHYSFDILERCPGVNPLDLFKSFQVHDFQEVMMFLAIVGQQKEKTPIGKKIEANFTLGDNTDRTKFIEFRIGFLGDEFKKSLDLKNFVRLFSNSEINQNFDLTEQFGDSVIDALERATLSGICDICCQEEFFEQLNENQKTRFLSALQTKLSSEKELKSRDLEADDLLRTLQHHLNLPEAKELVRSILSSNKTLNLEYLTSPPQFQDLLLEMHYAKDIDLNKIKLNKESNLYAKFDSQLEEEIKHPSGYFLINVTRDTYLKNYKSIKDFKSDTNFGKEIYWDRKKISSQKLTSSPLQITLFDLNENSYTKIAEKIISGELDANKILSINIFGIRAKSETPNSQMDSDKSRIAILNLLSKQFPNLKHLKVDTKQFQNPKSIEKLKEEFSKKHIVFEGYNYEKLTTTTTLTPALSERTFKAIEAGEKIYIGNANSTSAQKKDGEVTFLMREAGEIISRKRLSEALKVRNLSHRINSEFSGIKDNLFVDSKEPTEILSTENDSIEKFSKDAFEERKKQLKTADSEGKTICYFSESLKSGKKTALPSISPDNKIIGYYTEPSKANVDFFKDEESGFYFAKSKKNCKIHYIIEGKELESRTLTNDTNDLPPKIKEIIKDYVGNDSKNFPSSTSNDGYELPKFSTKEKFFEDLFNLTNKGSCRHRVVALAHKFEKEGLKLNEDFRIIGINGNHVLLEVKKQDGDWTTLDLGGDRTRLEETSQSRSSSPSSSFPHQLSMSLPTLSLPPLLQSSSETESQNTNNSWLASCFSCLGFGNLQTDLSPSSPLELIQPQLTSTLIFGQSPLATAEIIRPVINLEEEAKGEEQKLLNLKIIKTASTKIHHLKKIDDLRSFKDTFEQFITKNESSSLFLKTARSEELKNYLLRMSDPEQDPLNSALSFGAFYASSTQDLTTKKPTINISQDAKTVTISDKTPILSFLENARAKADKQHALIIDWGKFDASSKVAFNTMFDKPKGKIDGQEIPDNVKIICIDSSKQKTTDSSILSRFDRSLDLSAIGKNKFTESVIADSSKIQEIIEFDGEGFLDWQNKLFGRIVVNGDKIEWQKSEFAKELESKKGQSLQLDFKNFSATQQQEMKLFFEEAKACGSIDYHDYKIKIPSDLTVNFVKKEFEFSEVLSSFKSSQESDSSKLQLNIYQNSLGSNNLPADIHLINSHLFDKLLAQPKIAENQYREELGLIQKTSEADSKTLKLFLSENLSEQQFYCLLNQAQQYQVSLELYLAKEVKMPDRGFKEFTQEYKPIPSFEETTKPQYIFPTPATISSEPPQLFLPTVSMSQPILKSPPRIIITNNIEESLAEFKQTQPAKKPLNLVNIEDVLYGDLFGKTQHQLISSNGGAQHFSFEKIESAIKTKLDAGETVILKGKFSDELLSLLHPQILDMQQNYSNLHFIIEDKKISQSQSESTKLSWLDPSLYQIKSFPKTAEKINALDGKENYPSVDSKISENSKEEAQDFIKTRKEQLQNLLETNSTLQIFGHSGVGKSSLLREVKENGFKTKGDVAIYNELSSFEAWAKDSESKTKILVIDEFNVDGSTNFTTFRDLANNPNSSQRIFHQGKFYDLDANHKVVFLGNDKNYGNRHDQKLFSDCAVAELHLKDFPVSYIYENILAKPIYQDLSDDYKTKLSEDEFKKIAIEKIKEYKAHNQGEHQPQDDNLPKETVRELQEKVLKEIVKKTQPSQSEVVQNANFIATDANNESIAELQSAIQIRQLQKSDQLPSQFLGTCGVIFEGDSGVGKSVMIEAVLENRGIKKTDSLENLAQQIERERKIKSEITPETTPHYYYKIPASLPIEEIEKNLIKAFELGAIVVFDEMNARIKEGGLEKTINALLTGQHPTNPQIKPESGFMLIASVNKATNSGRSNFSSAIEHRCNMIFAKPLSAYQKEDFEKIIGNWLENDKSGLGLKSDESKIEKVAESFKELIDKNPNAYNLRDLKKTLPEILKKLEAEKSAVRH